MTDNTRLDPRTTIPVALLLLAVGAFFFSPVLKLPLIGVFFTLIGCGLFAPVIDPGETPPQSDASIRRIPRWRMVVYGAGALCLIVAGIGSTPGSSILPPTTIGAQLALFVAGLVLIGVSALNTFQVRVDVVLVGIVVLGAFLRLIDLQASVHYFVDEMHFSNGVVHLRDDPYTPLFAPINLIASFPWLYPYLQSFSVEAFGTTLAALRLVSVVFGVLTIPAVYLLARALFDRPAALIAALVLATFPPHLHFSRLALNNIADPLFGVLALASLAWGVRKGYPGAFMLAGLALGLTQYFYEGGRTIYPIIMSAWLIVAVMRREIRDVRLPMLTALTALIVALPLVIALVGWEMPYFPRLETKAFSGDFWIGDEGSYLGDQLIPALAHIVYQPDGSAFYYGGGTALILPVLVPAFFAGAMRVLRRRSTGGVMLLLLVILTALGNSLIDESDWSARFVVILPALALLIAAGVRLLDGRRLLVVGVVIAIVQVSYYFVPHLNTYNHQIRTQRDHQDVMWRARDLPPGTQVYLFTNDFTFLPHFQGMNRFWRTDIDVQVMVNGTDQFVPPRGEPLALFVNPEEVLTIVTLGRIYDLPEPTFSPYNVPLERQYALFTLLPPPR